MRLLVVTQAVDSEDPVLGFFVRWIEELAKHVEAVEVICLRKGVYCLPDNVRVHSLGKERGTASRAAYVWRFLALVWRLRHAYSAVFVHMNPEYVMLAGFWWRLSHRGVALWYNHPHKGVRFVAASYLADIVFYTSPYAAPAGLRKARRMPAGIDTELFKPSSIARQRHAIYMQGRITPSKNVQDAIEALQILRGSIPATLVLVGPKNPAYESLLRKRYPELVTVGAVVFSGQRRNVDTPPLYATAGVSINLAAAGHFDKSVLESMACETPVILSSQAFEGLVPARWIVPEHNPPLLAKTLAQLMELPEFAYRALGRAERLAVEREHRLPLLIEGLCRELSDI